MDINKQLRARRRALDLDQSVIAATAGCTRSTVSNLERGATKPSWELIERIVAVLGGKIVISWTDPDPDCPSVVSDTE